LFCSSRLLLFYKLRNNPRTTNNPLGCIATWQKLAACEILGR
jgi:hypothetical protein